MNKHPLDFDALARGDTISGKRVERALNLPRKHRLYRHMQMQLAARIEAHVRSQNDDNVTVLRYGGGLRILTFEEQAQYAPAAADACLRHYRRIVGSMS